MDRGLGMNGWTGVSGLVVGRSRGVLVYRGCVGGRMNR
jgi:hypothetical protein